jgi:hypothetical protein
VKKHPSFRPDCEALETRLNPGVCTVSLSAGTLTITGSAGDDSIAMSQPAFGQITLTGNGTTTFRLGSTGPTVTGPVTFGTAAAPVRTVNANLNTGNDTFSIDYTTSITLAGSLSIAMGLGNNQVTPINVTTTTSLNVGGSVSITAGSGNDNLQFGSANIGGSLTINAGDGTNTIIAAGAEGAAFNSTVAGAVNITSGAGQEFILFERYDVNGLTTINTGTGNVANGNNAQVFLNATDNINTPMHLNGGLSIQSAPLDTGRDFIVAFDGLIVGGAGLNINTAGGDDQVVLIAFTNTAGTVINTGAGNDLVDIFGDQTQSTFAGPFVLNMGDGNDTFTLGQGTFGAEFQGTVNANLGAGNDSLFLAGASVLFDSANSVIDGGAGFNQSQTSPNAIMNSAHLPLLFHFFSAVGGGPA